MKDQRALRIELTLKVGMPLRPRVFFRGRCIIVVRDRCIMATFDFPPGVSPVFV